MLKRILFQAIQFRQQCLKVPSIIKNSIRESFIYSRLNVKPVLFQAIQFSIRTLFSFIWSIDRTRIRVDLGAMEIKGYSAFPQTSELLEPHYQIV